LLYKRGGGLCRVALPALDTTTKPPIEYGSSKPQASQITINNNNNHHPKKVRRPAAHRNGRRRARRARVGRARLLRALVRWRRRWRQKGELGAEGRGVDTHAPPPIYKP
jgi:hypothetical protein